MEKTKIKFRNESLDKKLNLNENREINEYFQTYKCNSLLVGGTTAGKTTYLLNLITQNIFPFNKLYLFAPEETLTSGLMAKFINMAKNSKMKDRIIIYNLSEHRTPVFEYFADQRRRYENSIKGVGKKDLFVFDDFIFATTKNEKKFVHRLLVNSSRLSADVLLLVQSIKDFPPEIFGNIQIFIIFAETISRTQVETILRRTGVIDTRSQMFKLLKITNNINPDPKQPLIIVKSAPVKYRLIFDNNYIPLSEIE